jgi:site-specific recombinase XerC
LVLIEVATMRKIDPVSAWLNTVSYQYSQSKKTEEQYKRVWGRFTAFAETSAEAILSDYQTLIQENSGYDIFKRRYASIIRNWICQLSNEGLTNISINVMVGAIKSFFKWNDLPLGRIPQAKHGETFHNKDITKEEIVQIMANLRMREKAFCAVMTQSGLRPVTIAQLRMKNLESLEKIPCKIDIPDKIAKGKYGCHITFIGEDATKYLKQYLATRTDLTPESLVFCSHSDLKNPVNVKDVSRAFRLAARKLQESGAISYEVREGKPSELRLYNLRKFFRKYAIQMGFEVVEYMMGHIIKGVDGSYRPQDPEYYRELYAEKAMPFLRLEAPTPTETTEIIEMLKQQHKKEIEAIKAQYEKRLEKIENILFPKVRVITDWQAEAKRIREWIEKHPEEVERDQERYYQDIEEVEAWKKLMLEDPEGVATYFQDVDNKLNFIKYLFQKRNETKET